MTRKRTTAGSVRGTAVADYIETKPSDVSGTAKHHGITRWTKRTVLPRVVHEDETIRVLRHRKDHAYKSMCMFFDQDERRLHHFEGARSLPRLSGQLYLWLFQPHQV